MTSRIRSGLIIVLVLFTASARGAIGAAHEEVAPSVVTVRTFDCSDGDVHDVTSCVPISGVPIRWQILYRGPLTEDAQEIQGRFTLDDGTDQFEIVNAFRVDLNYDPYVAWDDNELVPLVPYFTILPQPGQSITLDFILVPSGERVIGTGSVSFRALDCSNGTVEDPSSCIPVSGVGITAIIEGVLGDRREYRTDEQGMMTVAYPAPSRAIFTVPIDQTCFEGMERFDLIPTQTQWTVMIIDGDQIAIDIVFLQADQADATPAVSYQNPAVAEIYFTPCEREPLG